MPVGLEVYDENGQVVMSVTDRITKILGTIDTGLSNGTLAVPEFSRGRPWFYAFCSGSGNSTQIPATVTVNGNSLVWQYPAAGASGNPPSSNYVNTKILYGVY